MDKSQRQELAKFFQTEHIDEIFERSVVIKDGMPIPLEVELTLSDACTRHCQFCPRNNDTIAPHTSLRMTKQLYTKVARELKELGFKGLLMLSGYGEVLMHPDIIDIVKLFSFATVNVTTNGDRLTPELLDQLVGADVNKILISVYEEQLWDKFTDLIKGYEDKVILRNRYDSEKFDRLYNNRAGALYQEKGTGVCYYPFYLLMVDANGDVYSCCHEWQRRLKVGNLYQHTIWEVWTSDKIRRLRKDLKSGDRSFYPCRVCNVNGTLRGENNFELFTQ